MMPANQSTKTPYGQGLVLPPGVKSLKDLSKSFSTQPNIYGVFQELKDKGAANLKDANVSPPRFLREPDKDLSPRQWEEWNQWRQGLASGPAQTPTPGGQAQQPGAITPGAIQRRRRTLAINPNRPARGGSGTLPAPTPSPITTKQSVYDRVGINPPAAQPPVNTNGPKPLPAFGGGNQYGYDLYKNSRNGVAYPTNGAQTIPLPNIPLGGQGWRSTPPSQLEQRPNQQMDLNTQWQQQYNSKPPTPQSGIQPNAYNGYYGRPHDINLTGRSSNWFPMQAAIQRGMPNAQVKMMSPQASNGRNFQSNPAGDKFNKATGYASDLFSR